MQFAHNEVGAQFLVIADSGRVVAYGDVDGLAWMLDTCPDCGLHKEAGYGLYGCERCGT